jgi:hypothetical protein
LGVCFATFQDVYGDRSSRVVYIIEGGCLISEGGLEIDFKSGLLVLENLRTVPKILTLGEKELVKRKIP